MKFIFKTLLNIIVVSIVMTIILPTISNAQESEFHRKTIHIIELQEAGEFEQVLKLSSKDFQEKADEKMLKDIWREIQQQYGNLYEFGEYTYNESENAHTIIQVLRFENKEIAAKLVFNDESEIIGYFIQAAPTKDFSPAPLYTDNELFEEKEIIIESGDIELPGKITIPLEGENFPLVILVHGSGPNDMDETIGPNKIFRDIAWGLSSNGIAVLRYDKRTLNHFNSIDNNCFTLKEKVENDVHSAIEMALNIENINTDKIFILGHSLGGLAAPRIAKHNDNVSGIILMAVNSRKLYDLIEDQYDYLFSMQEATQEVKDNIKFMKEKLQIVREGDFDESTSSADLPLWNVCFWLDINDYDHVKTAAEIKQAVLILQGERDYQVPMREFYGWRSGLSKKENASFKWYPGLNHLFMPGVGKPNPQEYLNMGNVNEVVIKDIVKWLNQQ